MTIDDLQTLRALYPAPSPYCAKAVMRSKPWSDGARIDRASWATMGQMINDQTGIDAPPETEAQMRQRYAADL